MSTIEILICFAEVLAMLVIVSAIVIAAFLMICFIVGIIRYARNQVKK